MYSQARNRRLTVFVLLAACFLCLTTSCKKGRPDGIMSASKLEELLYDYHLAIGRGDTYADSAEIKRSEFVAEVFAKYGITQEDFDRNMEYYCRHSDKLYDIYEKLVERYDAAVGEVGTSMRGDQKGDTLTIWGMPFCLLSANAQNHMQYSCDADTLLRPGDHVVLELSTAWYYHEGAKRMNAVLALEYEGDSVVTMKRDLESSTQHELVLEVGNRAKLRRVTFLLYQDAPWDKRPRLVAINSPRLMRVRKENAPQPPTVPPDSTRRDSAKSGERAIRDSLLRLDTARTDHFGGQQ